MAINEFIVIIAMTNFALAPPVYESRLAHFVHYSWWGHPHPNKSLFGAHLLTKFAYS